MLAWLLILVPLVLYLVAFSIEAFLSFKRLSSSEPDDPYLVATWGVTHTLLVVAVAYFFIIFSANLDVVAKASYVGLFVAGIGILIRAALYLQLFVVRGVDARKHRNWVDTAFFVSHLLIVVGVVILLIQLIPALITNHITPGTGYVEVTWAGLILVAIISVLPAIALYRSRKAGY